MKTTLALLLVLLGMSSAVAWSPATPYRHVVTSQGKFLFVMNPGNFDNIEAKGIAYKATRHGFKKLWSISGWYGFPGEVFLSPDGQSLVRIRGQVIVSGDAKLQNENVVFIYYRGKLKAKYRIEDLIQNLKEGTRRSAFGPWGNLWMTNAKIARSDWHRITTQVEGQIASVHHPSVFHLTTLKKIHFIFDLRTGAILGKKTENQKAQEDEVDDSDPFKE